VAARTAVFLGLAALESLHAEQRYGKGAGVPLPRVTYVFDAYCGWSYGFSPSVNRFIQANGHRVELRVVSGGLLTGDSRVPVSAFGHLAQTNHRIGQLTGAQFGQPYQRLLAGGRFVMDSEAAARGFAALRQAAPGEALKLAYAMQIAFYRNGRDLSDPDTYINIALDAGLDPTAVIDEFRNDRSARAAVADFSLARQLGADSFPMLLVETGGRRIQLGGVVTEPERLTQELDAALGLIDHSELNRLDNELDEFAYH
jgi:putative protein-disulfide isomerase